MSSSNFFTRIENVAKDDFLSSVMQPDNVFPVQGQLGSIQLAINTAVAQGFTQWNPAVILITPDSSSGTSTTDVQFTENVTLYDGIYVQSQVPYKSVFVNGTLALGSTALATQPDGVANTTIRYIVSDLYFIANAGGAPMLNATTAVVTRLFLTRVTLNNTGTAASNNCLVVNSASAYTLMLDNCNLLTAGNNASVNALSVSGGAHSVTLKNNTTVSVSGALAVNSALIDGGAAVTADDCDFKGLINLGANTVSTFTARFSRIVGNVAAATGLITFAANNASIADTQFCTFTPATHVNIFTVGGPTNIVKGGNCVWVGVTTAITALNSGAVAATSWWSGGPIPKATSAPANAIANSLWADTDAAIPSAVIAV